NRGELPITLHENSPPIVERGSIRPLDTRRGHSSRELPICWFAWSERRCLSAQCVPQRGSGSPKLRFPGVSRLHCRSSRASITGALRYTVRLETPGNLSGDRCRAEGQAIRQEPPACSYVEPP